MSQEYFSPQEKTTLLQLVKNLNDKLGSQLSCQDINTLHDLIEKGITQA